MPDRRSGSACRELAHGSVCARALCRRTIDSPVQHASASRHGRLGPPGQSAWATQAGPERALPRGPCKRRGVLPQRRQRCLRGSIEIRRTEGAVLQASGGCGVLRRGRSAGQERLGCSRRSRHFSIATVLRELLRYPSRLQPQT
jgi:hypothetical protein